MDLSTKSGQALLAALLSWLCTLSFCPASCLGVGYLAVLPALGCAVGALVLAWSADEPEHQSTRAAAIGAAATSAVINLVLTLIFIVGVIFVVYLASTGELY